MWNGLRDNQDQPLPLIRLPLSAQANGIRISGGSGSGKSILAGWIAFENFRKGIPTVILDPHGGTIDFFLSNVWKWCYSNRLIHEEQQRLWQRIYYADMSGKSGRVTTFPIYYRLGNESLHEISQRLVSTIVRLDSALMSASIEGFNALTSILTPAGMIMAALDLQVTEIIDLLQSPNAGAWRERFAAATATYPEVQSAVDFFKREYFNWKADVRFRRIGSLMVKLNSFRYSPMMRATYGASEPSIDWAAMIDQGKTVCLDFRSVLNSEERRFGLLWCLFYSLVEYIKHRGKGRHHQSVGLIIDELSEFGQLQAEAGSNIFSTDLNHLINVLKRQYRLLLTIIHQEAYQLDPMTRKTLLSMGTQILGVSHDQESALEMAQQFIPYRPHLKRREPIYARTDAGPTVIDHRPVEYSVEELRALAAQLFTKLGRFKFLAKLSTGEGDTSGRFLPMSIEPLIGQWVDEEKILSLRQLLTARDGVPIETVLTEIDGRLVSRGRSDKKKIKMKSGDQSVTLEEDEQLPGRSTDHISEATGELDDSAFYY